METDQKKSIKLVISKKAVFVSATLFIILCLTVGGILFLKAGQPQSLLPESVAKQTTQFTPFFFFDKIPGNYSLDTSSISFDQGIAIIPLTRPDSPSVTITEQLLPENFSPDLIRQDNSQQVKDTAAPAIINKIEGRTVGIMTSDEHNVLLIINAPGDMSAEDMTMLLQGLKPIR